MPLGEILARLNQWLRPLKGILYCKKVDNFNLVWLRFYGVFGGELSSPLPDLIGTVRDDSTVLEVSSLSLREKLGDINLSADGAELTLLLIALVYLLPYHNIYWTWRDWTISPTEMSAKYLTDDGMLTIRVGKDGDAEAKVYDNDGNEVMTITGKVTEIFKLIAGKGE